MPYLALSWHQANNTSLKLDAVMKQLIEFCREARFIYDMMKLLGWQDRTKFRRKFIHPLLENGLITMSIPDKPKSPHQQYIITGTGVSILEKKS